MEAICVRESTSPWQRFAMPWPNVTPCAIWQGMSMWPPGASKTQGLDSIGANWPNFSPKAPWNSPVKCPPPKPDLVSAPQRAKPRDIPRCHKESGLRALRHPTTGYQTAGA
eukprot:gene37806-46648_t